MKKNDHSKYAADFCSVCGKKKGIIVAPTMKFKASKSHSTGPCEECKKKLDSMVDKLMAGGTMLRCTICGAVSVMETVPEALQYLVAKMPNGVDCLEIAGCPACKEAEGAEDNTTPNTDGGLGLLN